MLYWWCIMLVHHCTPDAQCHVACAVWLCTIVHNGMLVVHKKMGVHHCAPGAHCYTGGFPYHWGLVPLNPPPPLGPVTCQTYWVRVSTGPQWHTCNLCNV